MIAGFQYDVDVDDDVMFGLWMREDATDLG